MTLPSGTSISASNVNSYLGRSAGTQMSFNTTIRSLSNNNTSPNMNAIRGQSAFSIGWNTGQTSDVVSGAYIDPQYESVSAWLLPNSPWRVVVNQYMANVSGSNRCTLELRVLGTNFGVSHRYRLSNVSGALIYPGYYMSSSFTTAMLSNGKFIIAMPVAGAAGSNYGNVGYITFIVLTFNTDGTIASTSQYAYAAGSGSYYIGATNYIAPNPRLASVNGNKFCFCLSRYGVGQSLVTVDASSSTLSVVQDNISGGTQYGAGGQWMPVLNSDGSISVLECTASYQKWWAQLNAAGTSWSTSSTRWNNALAYYALTTLNNQTYFMQISTTIGYMGLQDKKGNFFAITGLSNSYGSQQVQASPLSYASGTVSALMITKITSNNSASWAAYISGQSYYYATASSGKSGTVYTYIPYYWVDYAGVKSIETDNSGNTYILYRTWSTGQGIIQGDAAATNIFSFSSPSVQQEIYNLTKLNSSGVAQWTKQFDIGPKTRAAIPTSFNYIGTPQVWQPVNEQLFNDIMWCIICNDDISAVEVYAMGNPFSTAYAYQCAFPYGQYTSRAVMLRMSDGAVATYSDSSNPSLLTSYQQTSITSVSMYANTNNGATATIKFVPPQTGTQSPTYATISATPTSTRTTSSVGLGSSSALFTQDPTTYQTGTTWNTATY